MPYYSLKIYSHPAKQLPNYSSFSRSAQYLKSNCILNDCLSTSLELGEGQWNVVQIRIKINQMIPSDIEDFQLRQMPYIGNFYYSIFAQIELFKLQTKFQPCHRDQQIIAQIVTYIGKQIQVGNSGYFLIFFIIYQILKLNIWTRLGSPSYSSMCCQIYWRILGVGYCWIIFIIKDLKDSLLISDPDSITSPHFISQAYPNYYIFTIIIANMKNRFCTVSIKSNSLLSCLSVSTMCLLVFTSIIIITIISITPIIILGLGEINAGQRDVVLTPLNYQGYLNATKISQLSGQIAMPRLSTTVILKGQSGIGWFMDLQLEDKNHLGTLPLNRNLSEGQYPLYAHMQFGLSVGEKVPVQLLDKDLLSSLALNMDPAKLTPQILSDINFLKEIGEPLTGIFTVAGVFDMALGKFPIGMVGGNVYLDINNALQHFIQSTLAASNRTNSKLVEFLENKENFKLSDFSNSITINIPNRIEVYSNSDYQETYNTLSSFGAQILQKIGMFSVNSQIPIAASLTQMSYFGMFIGVILKLVIISLFVLSVLMMNNMMLMGIQRKSFDFALIKTMGADKIFVVANLLLSSTRYVLISNIIAFPFAYFTLSLISGIFLLFFGYSYQITPTFSAIVGGFIIGVLVPIISSISPIWGIINNDLVQNLNPVRNKTQAIHTEIYVQGSQFPVGKLTFGIISSAFGLMIYYLLPKGLINQDIGLLLVVFFAIIIGLLLGLILISYSVQYLFQKLVAYLTLFWVNKTDFILTLKNMSAHRFKNRRASLLYSLSVAFIIFVSVGISIQMQTISDFSMARHGTYMEIISSSGSVYRPFYEKILSEDFKDDIQDWAYQTDQLSYQIENVVKNQFSDKARIFFTNMRIYGVSPNYAKVQPVYRLPIVKTYAYTPYDPYEFLYSPEGYMTCIVSQYAGNEFNLINTQNREITLNIYQRDKVERIKLNVSTVFTQTAGLSYSRFEFGRHDVAISFDTYAQIMGLKTYDQLPLKKIKLKVKNPGGTAQLANRLRAKMSQRNSNYVWDYSESKATRDKIEDLLKNILNILLVLVLLISFFSLVTTSYINIINQSTQIGILLTLGYNKSRIVRIFIYESFVLVLNSCLIGVAVGTFVAWMMGLQRELFGDFPVTLQIDGIWIIAIAAVISSLLSIIKPIREIFGQSINQIFMYS